MASKTVRLWIGLAMIAAAKGAQTDACALLSSEGILRATGEQVANTKATSQTAGKVRQSQCFYTLPTFTNSISVPLPDRPDCCNVMPRAKCGSAGFTAAKATRTETVTGSQAGVGGGRGGG